MPTAATKKADFGTYEVDKLAEALGSLHHLVYEHGIKLVGGSFLDLGSDKVATIKYDEANEEYRVTF